MSKTTYTITRRYIMLRIINEGIKYNAEQDDFEFDFKNNDSSDIIEFVKPVLYTFDTDDKTFWFGYEFSDNSTPRERANFIHYIKGLNKNHADKVTMDRFIKRPLGELDKKIRTHSIDCFVCPKSGRSDLVNQIVKAIGDVTSRDIKRCSIEAIKSIPSEISFDYDRFDYEVTDEYAKKQMLDYVDNVLMPKIHNLDYFSLAKDVKPKYRPYIMNYLNISEQALDASIKLENAENVLIVDDILTTGNTVEELVRLIRKVNKDCNIYIYTLIGRSK